ncbi:MAG: hypothetical protein HFH68_04290 [Lachnospiraceae bacterium]|nr:hypothetical protein [Lachnospiraceae bacterium]
MKNIEKRKLLRFTIFMLFVLVFASVFIVLYRWFHSDGMHFIGNYGQIHISKMCEGIDQDGNKIKSKKIVIDGVVTKERGNRLFDGDVNIINGLPEGVIPAFAPFIEKYDGGLYKLPSYFFMDIHVSYRVSLGEERENRSCYSIVWLKDGEIAMEFYKSEDGEDRGDTNGYYLYYSDIKMLDIEEVREKVNRDIE